MLRSELFTDDKVDLKVLKERALGMRWAGMPEGTIPLTSADPDFKPAIEIREAMTDFIKGGYFPYAPDALPGLREAISGSLKVRKNEDVPPEFIQPVDSASTCMHAIALSVLKPGDEVIIFDPVDPAVRYYCALRRGHGRLLLPEARKRPLGFQRSRKLCHR